jgi:two-component system chemotaxis response regulator CheY
VKRILLVEDDLAVSYVFNRYLKAAGFAVSSAGNGAQALQLHAAEKIDAVVSDYRMPGMNGDALLLALRARDPHLPALMVSAYGHELRIAIPGVRVLAKPVTGDQLVNELHNLLLDAETLALNRPQA